MKPTKYHIEVVIDKPGFKDKKYVRVLNLNYTDETFLQCESMIRDAMQDVANSFISEEFYE